MTSLNEIKLVIKSVSQITIPKGVDRVNSHIVFPRHGETIGVQIPLIVIPDCKIKLGDSFTVNFHSKGPVMTPLLVA